MYFVAMLTGIASSPAGKELYPPLASGLKQQVFIRDASGLAPAEGRVWPGDVYFPDFLHPNASAYWLDQLIAFHSVLAFDGVWLDMNEPSNFCDGDCSCRAATSRRGAANGRILTWRKSQSADARKQANGNAVGEDDGAKQVDAEACARDGDEEERLAHLYASWKLRKRGGKRKDVQRPPYLPGGESLESRSLRMDARHCVDHLLSTTRRASRGHGGGTAGAGKDDSCTDATHYDTHNLYGLAETRVTAQALEVMTGKRPFIISRSTFPGSGVWAGHWLGDNEVCFLSFCGFAHSPSVSVCECAMRACRASLVHIARNRFVLPSVQSPCMLLFLLLRCCCLHYGIFC